MLNNIGGLLREILEKRELPYRQNLGRLLILNKKPEEIPNLDILRPINILPSITKLLDHIITQELKAFQSTR